MHSKVTLKDNSDLIYFEDIFDFEVSSANSNNIRMIAGLSHPGYKDISDHYNYIGLAAWVEREARKLSQFSSLADVNNTKYTFTFNYNKKQINRHLMLKLVEYFQLENYVYTWRGDSKNFDMSNIIQEWNHSSLNQVKDDSFKSFILSPVTINPVFYDTSDPWHNYLEKMHHQSAIALIAESITYKKNINFTEKTIYAMLGCNFPIWIGGYAQAEHWKSIGFDTFDDIIDHSYQYEDTLFDRIFLAFKLNLDLLTNFEKIKKLREHYFDRLKNNRQLVIDDQLKKYNHSVLNSLDPEIKQELIQVIEKIFNQ